MAKQSIARKAIKDVAIVAVGVLIFWFGLQLVFGTANPFYVVSSGSMVPELNVYDILVVQANDPFESVRLGDIIVFDRPSGSERVIVHRVVSIIDEDPYTLRTKGDANPASIPGTDFPITADEYLGTVSYVIPQAGFVTQIFAPPINYVLIAVVLGLLILKTFRSHRSERADVDPPAVEDMPDDGSYTDGPFDTDEATATDVGSPDSEQAAASATDTDEAPLPQESEPEEDSDAKQEKD